MTAPPLKSWGKPVGGELEQVGGIPASRPRSSELQEVSRSCPLARGLLNGGCWCRELQFSKSWLSGGD